MELIDTDWNNSTPNPSILEDIRELISTIEEDKENPLELVVSRETYDKILSWKRHAYAARISEWHRRNKRRGRQS